jgi:hypothetical protein
MEKWNGFAAPIVAAQEHHKRKENSGKVFYSSLVFSFCVVHENLFFLLHVLHYIDDF